MMPATLTAPTSIILDSDQAKRQPNVRPRAKPISKDVTTSAEPVRVLLVDDNEAMLARAAAVLAPHCVVVGSVTDGASALKAATTLRPHVIVLDISMKGMTGLEVASGLREAHSTTAIVFLTVHEDEEFVQAAKAAGGIGYVVKPRLASDLMHAVREARAGRSFVSPRR
jgi:DNA-binding NarL/FixJ family response regulator